jgi:hypothetical protein
VHNGYILNCRAYKKIHPKIILHRMHCMAWCIIFFLKSLRGLEEFRKNPHIKIPPNSSCTNFQSIGIFKNPKKFLKSNSLQISAQPAKPRNWPVRSTWPTRRLLPPSALKQGNAPATASQRCPDLARHGSAAPSSAPHPLTISPSSSLHSMH